MSITSLFRGLRNELLPRIHPRRRPCRHHYLKGRASRGDSRALRVESLEGRLLLTAYIVDTTVDDPCADGDAQDGFVSLREAIIAANTNSQFGDASPGEGGSVVDSITFADSLMGQTILLGGDELKISEKLSLAGPLPPSNDPSATKPPDPNLTVSGNKASRVFSIAVGVTVDISNVIIADGAAIEGGGIHNEGTLTLDNCTLTNNSTDGYGGAICNYSTESDSVPLLTITNCTFTGNSADEGGGIANVNDEQNYEFSGTVTITGSTFSGNAAYHGGAIYQWSYSLGVNYPPGTAIITGSTFTENKASSGGAVYVSNSVAKIANSTFSNNTAKGYGGAIHTWTRWTIVEIKGSTFSANCAGRMGGAIDDNYGTLKIINTTISGNSTNHMGGAIYKYGGNLEITNSTLTANRADADGDGNGNGGALYDDGDATYLFDNTIVAGNVVGRPGSDTPNEFYVWDGGAILDPNSCSHNLIGDAASAGGLSDGVNGNIVGNGGTGTIDITTVLDPNLADNGGPTKTHALVPGGLAVNAGDNGKAVDAEGNPLVYDQRGEGFARIVDGTVDIGAFEVQPQILSVEIDVKPGSDPNSINLASNGVIAVAIFTTADFDASLVNASTVVFAEASAVHWCDGRRRRRRRPGHGAALPGAGHEPGRHLRPTAGRGHRGRRLGLEPPDRIRFAHRPDRHGRVLCRFRRRGPVPLGQELARLSERTRGSRTDLVRTARLSAGTPPYRFRPSRFVQTGR